MHLGEWPEVCNVVSVTATHKKIQKGDPMKQLRTSLLVAAIAAVTLTTAKADERDKFTKITVNEPVRLPGLTLQPGNYTLRLLEDGADRHIVKVSDENGKGMAIILAMPNYRLVPKDKTVLTYWEVPAGQPRPIRAWFWPGDNYGQEFAYPKSEADQISSYQNQKVATVADNTNETELKTAKVTESDNTPFDAGTPSTTVAATPAPAQTESQANIAAAPAPAPQPEPQIIAQATPPQQAPTVTDVTPAATPAPATPDTLPQTGTDLPTIGLIGALSFAAFLTTLGKSKRV